MIRPFKETATNTPFPYVEPVHASVNDGSELVVHVIPSLEYAYVFVPVFVRAKNKPFP
jgi:hypothetical protein